MKTKTEYYKDKERQDKQLQKIAEKTHKEYLREKDKAAKLLEKKSNA